METKITTKIKKVNSLDELDQLVPGDLVNVIDYLEGGIFEGKIGAEYRFMGINYPIIWSHRINEENIQFKNGMIKSEGNKMRLESYDKERNNCYQEKLNLIKEKINVFTGVLK